MKDCCITYCLHVNKEQYSYICNEIQKTRQIYIDCCKCLNQNKCMNIEKLKYKIESYINKNAKFLTILEKQALMKDILFYYENHIEQYYYRCHQITENGYWRNINLFSLIYDIPKWQLIPIKKKWKIIDSYIWYRNHKVYLRLQFCNNFLLCE